MAMKEQLRELSPVKGRKFSLQSVSPDHDFTPVKFRNTNRVGSSDVQDLRVSRMLFDLSAQSGSGGGADMPDRSGSGSASESSRPGNESNPPLPPSGRAELGETPDPRRHLEEAQSLAARKIKEGDIDTVVSPDTDSYFNIINSAIETGIALYLIERIEHPEADINLRDIANVAIDPDVLVNLRDSVEAGVLISLNTGRSLDAEVAIEEPERTMTDPVRQVPNMIEERLERFSDINNARLIELEAGELKLIREKAREKQSFFERGGVQKSLAEIYADDQTYYGIVSSAYNGNRTRFIATRREIAHLHTDFMANLRSSQGYNMNEWYINSIGMVNDQVSGQTRRIFGNLGADGIHGDSQN